MSVERIDKEPGKESPSKKVADMDSLCEEISRAIVEGLVEKEILDEPELGAQGESHFAETAVIGSLDDVHADQMATAVESLLESDVLSQKIVQLVQEKIREFLTDDAVQSRRGDSGVIAEHVHAECARLFECESFRSDVVKLLRADVERTLAPALRRDMSACVQSMVTEIAGVLVERLAGEFAKMKEAVLPSPPAGEPRAEAPAGGASAAPRAAEPCTAALAVETCLAPSAGEPRAATLAAETCAVLPEAPRATPAGAGARAPDRPAPRFAAPRPPPPSCRAASDADERAASAYLRIRDRLLWRGAL
ncbi:MAG TPA: hypothetical protein DCM87_14075 [Planctomycetes bacterium]|nr:hypothetical protein [Planctomycetota bacterium]